MKNIISVSLVMLFSMLLNSCNEENCQAPEIDTIHETEEEYNKRMAWFTDARFGIMVHWGPVTVSGKEISWSRWGYRRDQEKMPEWDPETMLRAEVYDSLYLEFNPVEFDADEWMQLVKDAGAKYFVFTSKHHDGFFNFDTKTSDYKITSERSPYGKDICRQLSNSAEKYGIRLGWYYSPTDWYDQDFYTENHSKYIDKMHTNVVELLTNYNEIDLIWFDAGAPSLYWDSIELREIIRGINPDIIINDRSVYPKGDFNTPEGRIPDFNNKRPWESVLGISEYWSYKPNSELIPAKQWIRNLCWCSGKDGNLLLNITPDPLGRIEDGQKEILHEIGDFMEKHGNVIYGTEGGPYVFERFNMVSTYKDNYLNILVLNDYGADVIIPALDNEIIRREDFNIDKLEFAKYDGVYTLKAEGIQGAVGIIRIEFKNDIDNKIIYVK